MRDEILSLVAMAKQKLMELEVDYDSRPPLEETMAILDQVELTMDKLYEREQDDD